MRENRHIAFAHKCICPAAWQIHSSTNVSVRQHGRYIALQMYISIGRAAALTVARQSPDSHQLAALDADEKRCKKLVDRVSVQEYLLHMPAASVGANNGEQHGHLHHLGNRNRALGHSRQRVVEQSRAAPLTRQGAGHHRRPWPPGSRSTAAPIRPVPAGRRPDALGAGRRRSACCDKPPGRAGARPVWFRSPQPKFFIFLHANR